MEAVGRLVDLMKHVVAKMNGKGLIRMRRTCKSMAPLVDHSLTTFDYKDMIIAKVFMFCVTFDVSEKSKIFTVFKVLKITPESRDPNDAVALPIEFLQSPIWRFVSYEGNNAAKYLEKMRVHENCSEHLTATACDISTIARAMKIFKPLNTTLGLYTGDIHNILPAIPFKEWKKNKEGNIYTFGQTQWNDIPSFLGDFIVEEKPPRQNGNPFEQNSRHFEITTADEDVIRFTVSPVIISYVKG